jgi:hypothetical protein
MKTILTDEELQNLIIPGYTYISSTYSDSILSRLVGYKQHVTYQSERSTFRVEIRLLGEHFLIEPGINDENMFKNEEFRLEMSIIVEKLEHYLKNKSKHRLSFLLGQLHVTSNWSFVNNRQDYIARKQDHYLTHHKDIIKQNIEDAQKVAPDGLSARVKTPWKLWFVGNDGLHLAQFLAQQFDAKMEPTGNTCDVWFEGPLSNYDSVIYLMYRFMELGYNVMSLEKSEYFQP